MLDSITGEVRVFQNHWDNGKKGKSFAEATFYKVQIGSNKIVEKDKKGKDVISYDNYYCDVNFTKGCEDKISKYLPEKEENTSFDVLIKKSWFSCYRDKDDNQHLKLVIDDCQVIANK